MGLWIPTDQTIYMRLECYIITFRK